MQSKQIHIVFQVLNFLASDLSDPYALTSDEKLLLIFLAKYKGAKGIYPSVTTLSRELKRSDSAVRRSLCRLSKKQLILIDHVPGKSSYYTLILPDKLSTTPSVHARTSVDEPLASTLGHPRRARQDTPSVHARQLDISNNKRRTERGSKRRSLALSDDFIPNEESCKQAWKSGLTEEEGNLEFDKFMNHYKASGDEKTDWQLILQNWFIRAGDYKRKGKGKTKKDELCSTVREYKHSEEPVKSDPTVVKNALKGIMAKLKGRSADGLGSEGEGEEG